MRRYNKKVVHLRGLDGDAPVLLILAGVCEAGFSGLGAGDNSGLRDQGIRQGRLAVVNVSDDGHVTDVPLLVHHATDLVYGEIHLKQRTPPLITSSPNWRRDCYPRLLLTPRNF